MATPPAAPIEFPPGYLEVDHGPRVIAATTTILVLTTVLFGMRLVARSLTSAKRGWDDHVLIPAYILLIGLLITLYIDVKRGGLGRHAAAVMMEDPDTVRRFLLMLYALDWFYVPSNMLSRLSVVILYLRIFTDKWARAACWAVAAFLIANCVSNVIAAQLECMPLAFTWDKTIPNGKCFDQVLWYKIANFPNIVADICIFILPIRTVWTLNASYSQKVGISIVCFTGSIGIIASSVRTSVFFLQADLILSDPTFCDEAFSWTAIECGLYFSASCLIGLRPLFARATQIFKGRLTRVSHDNETANGPHGDAIRLNRSYKNSNVAADVEEDTRHTSIGLSMANAQTSPRSFVGGRHGDGIHVETSIHVVHA